MSLSLWFLSVLYILLFSFCLNKNILSFSYSFSYWFNFIFVFFLSFCHCLNHFLIVLPFLLFKIGFLLTKVCHFLYHFLLCVTILLFSILFLLLSFSLWFSYWAVQGGAHHWQVKSDCKLGGGVCRCNVGCKVTWAVCTCHWLVAAGCKKKHMSCLVPMVP